jgi:tetratricopeptide (TPR) repeat protein
MEQPASLRQRVEFILKNDEDVDAFLKLHRIEARALLQELKSDPSLQPEKIRLATLLGQASRWFGDFKTALSDLNRAFEEAQTLNSPPLLVRILEHRGRVRSDANDHQRAIDDVEHALTLAKANPVTGNLTLARLHITLAWVLLNDARGLFDAAEQAYERARGILGQERHPSRQCDLLFADVEQGAAHAQRHKAQLRRCIPHYQNALAIFARYLPDDHPFVNATYHNLGSLGLSTDFERFHSVGIDYETSRRYMDRCLKSSVKAFGITTRASAIGHQWLSQMMYVNDELASALSYRDQAIAIWIELLGPEALDLVYSHYWRARILEKIVDGSVRDASVTATQEDVISEYRRCIAIGRLHPAHARINFNIDYMKNAQSHLVRLQSTVPPRV